MIRKIINYINENINDFFEFFYQYFNTIDLNKEIDISLYDLSEDDSSEKWDVEKE